MFLLCLWLLCIFDVHRDTRLKWLQCYNFVLMIEVEPLRFFTFCLSITQLFNVWITWVKISVEGWDVVWVSVPWLILMVNTLEGLYADSPLVRSFSLLRSNLAVFYSMLHLAIGLQEAGAACLLPETSCVHKISGCALQVIVTSYLLWDFVPCEDCP